jgi:hypothetical protein
LRAALVSRSQCTGHGKVHMLIRSPN